MRRLRVGGLVAALALVVLAVGASFASGGNSDAAHACQQGGYLDLHPTSGPDFKNAGECVSYAAHGGQFSTPLPSCTVTATTGCLTFDNEQLSDSSGTTVVTVTGSFSFDSTCDNTAGCGYDLPNTYAMGGGTYTEIDASGVTTSGTLTTAGDGTIHVGLSSVRFSQTTCSASADREVDLQVSVDDATTIAALAAATGSSHSSFLEFADPGIPLQGSASNVTIDC